MQVDVRADGQALATDERAQIALFERMLRIRSVEEAIAARYSKQEMRCPVHLSIGQEAVAVGVCDNLGKEDYVLSSHRCHAHYLAKGGSLEAMLAEIHGKETGCCKGKGGSMHLVDLEAGFLGAAPIVGSTIPVATGAALGVSMKGEDRVVVVFFGEGATEEGVFSESLNFAALKNLPVVFVCENNLYSVYSSLAVRQPANRNVAMIARGHGLEALSGDGNDVMAVRRLTARAIEVVKTQRTPVFLELATYRWREHCGPDYDNHIGYRTEAEFESWRTKCPIAGMQALLIERDLVSDLDLAAMKTRIDAEIEEAFEFAEQSAFPDESALLSHVYSRSGSN